MENASKALLIAGGVLIAILLLTLFSYLFSNMASSSSKFYKLLEENQITEFNQKFLNYQDRELSIQDVVTIINLAKDNNAEKKRPVKIEVILYGNDWTSGKTEVEINNLMVEKINQKYRYENLEIDTETQLVRKIKIKQI